MLRPSYVRPAMKEGRELGVVVLMGYERESFEHGLEPNAGISGFVPDPGKKFEVSCDLTLMPGGQDRHDVREILV